MEPCGLESVYLDPSIHPSIHRILEVEFSVSNHDFSHIVLSCYGHAFDIERNRTGYDQVQYIFKDFVSEFTVTSVYFVYAESCFLLTYILIKMESSIVQLTGLVN